MAAHVSSPGLRSTAVSGRASQVAETGWWVRSLARIANNPTSNIPVLAIDLLASAFAVALGGWWYSATLGHPAPWLLTALFVPIVVALSGVRALYRRRIDRGFIDDVGRVETAVALAAVLLLSVMNLRGGGNDSGPLVSRVWICAAVLMPVSRLMYSTAQRTLRRHQHLIMPTLILGNGVVAGRVVERLRGSPQYGLKPVGILDVDTPDTSNAATGETIPFLGSPDSIDEAILRTGAKALVIAFSRQQDARLARVVHVANRHKLRVWVVPRMFDVVGDRTFVEHIGGLPLLALSHTDPRGWRFTVKHVLDRVAAAVGIVIISPLLVGLAVAVRLSSAGPVLFRQDRVGRDGRVFSCLKFRTMRLPADGKHAFAVEDGAAPGGVEGVDRRTAVGKFMRRTSLDELPQLVNVLRGEMSLVGPRPERPEFVEYFEIQIHRYGERHRVKAGMTGWAQVHGLRGQTSIADRAEFDNYYIQNWSLSLDLKTLFLTVGAVLRGAE
ncbi:UDP-phosphate galactose phosphotransferase [Mycobacterium sp. SWH-M1]|nr:UDP-phosphate galactose phosphotransferase [Mycobacterium sp. SWH-M1]